MRTGPASKFVLSQIWLSLAALAFLILDPTGVQAAVPVYESSLKSIQVAFFLLVGLVCFFLHRRLSASRAARIPVRLFQVIWNRQSFYLVLVCVFSALTIIGVQALFASLQGGTVSWLAAEVAGFLRPAFFWVSGFSVLSLISLWQPGQPHNVAIRKRLAQIPLQHWVFLAFVISFTLVYFRVFLLETGFLDFPEPVGSSERIGDDLRKYLGYSESTLIHNQYSGNYPPFPLLFFFPLLFVDFYAAYHLVAVLTYASYLFSIFVFPILMTKSKDLFTYLILFTTTGLFSYGLHWELENGQFNLIAFAFTLVGLWLFHKKPKRRLLAYLSFSVGLQLKLWPGIFIFMLIDDWQNWKQNFRRLGALLLANAGALFILGPGVFKSFMTNLSSTRGDYLWEGNHSIESFVVGLSQRVNLERFTFEVFQTSLLVIALAALGLVLYQASRRNQAGFNPYLFLALSAGALMLPPISNDYKLPVLGAPVLLLMATSTLPSSTGNRILVFMLGFLISLAYFLTLYSLGIRPDLIDNSFPLILAILLLTATLCRFQNKPQE